jgi:hypothetical protein
MAAPLLLVVMGAGIALMLDNSLPASTDPPKRPADSMTGLRVVIDPAARPSGQARGQLDGATDVTGGRLYYGWVVWPDPDEPTVVTTRPGLGPGVAYSREDVVAAVGPSATNAAFQLLDRRGAGPICLMVLAGDSWLAIPGASDGC